MKAHAKTASNEGAVEQTRLGILNGLSRRQRTFLLEKLVGLNDKDAALAAGYSLSIAENTKQKVWKPEVGLEYERSRQQVATALDNKGESESGPSDL